MLISVDTQVAEKLSFVLDAKPVKCRELVMDKRGFVKPLVPILAASSMKILSTYNCRGVLLYIYSQRVTLSHYSDLTKCYADDTSLILEMG